MSAGCIYYPQTYIPEVDAAVLSIENTNLKISPFDFADLFLSDSRYNHLTSLESMRAFVVERPSDFDDLLQQYISGLIPSSPCTLLIPDLQDPLYHALSQSSFPKLSLSVVDLMRNGLGLKTIPLERLAFLTRFQIMKDRRVLLYLLDSNADPRVQSQHIEQLLSLTQDKNCHVLVKYPYHVGADHLPITVPAQDHLSFDGEWYGHQHYRTTPSLTLKDALTHADLVITWDRQFFSADLLKNALFVDEKSTFSPTEVDHILTQKTIFSSPALIDFSITVSDSLKKLTDYHSSIARKGTDLLMPMANLTPEFRLFSSRMRMERTSKSILMASYLVRTAVRHVKRIVRLKLKLRAEHG